MSIRGERRRRIRDCMRLVRRAEREGRAERLVYADGSEEFRLKVSRRDALAVPALAVAVGRWIRLREDW